MHAPACSSASLEFLRDSTGTKLAYTAVGTQRCQLSPSKKDFDGQRLQLSHGTFFLPATFPSPDKAILMAIGRQRPLEEDAAVGTIKVDMEARPAACEARLEANG